LRLLQNTKSQQDFINNHSPFEDETSEIFLNFLKWMKSKGACNSMMARISFLVETKSVKSKYDKRAVLKVLNLALSAFQNY